MTITFMQSAAVTILLLVLAALVFVLFLAILYLVVRAAVRSGVDRSELSVFLRQMKLAEFQAKYEDKSADRKEE